KLYINDKKCFNIDFYLSGTFNYSPLFLDKSPLVSTSELKFLGIYLTSDMKLLSNFNRCYGKCISGMAALRKLASYGVNKWIIWRTYMALVFSYMGYAWPAICDLPIKYLHRLESSEKQCMALC